MYLYCEDYTTLESRIIELEEENETLKRKLKSAKDDVYYDLIVNFTQELINTCKLSSLEIEKITGMQREHIIYMMT